MHAITEKDLRASFVNVSLRERSAISLPDLAAADWDRLDYLGWRDPKQPLAGFIVVPVDGAPVGILLRQTEQRVRARAQCAWCEDVTLPNDVVFFSARRAGQAGRNGNTVGTLVCEGFECSVNVRRPLPPAYLGFDVEAARQRRIEALRAHAEGFARDLRDSR
ncbi:FBP domain-containing protein [Microbacterium allomyrinae]|uniref:FBP domain-containing protein n=1 Tax=Microbacterium allomyrinae TaxID=2830666 RepID=A0A9X1LV76_9MICO|nr:FBP domain-containing protein [Microbacterium allomyrinae]MCC2032782.1 FBP domain-containing protein [Microbacterium allomyrinae]